MANTPLLRLTLAELLLVVALLIGLGAFQLHSLEFLRGPPYCQDVALSPDGRMMLLAMGDGTCLFDLGSGRPSHRFEGPAYKVAFSPDGQRAALADYAGTIRIVDTETGRILSTDRHHLGSFSDIRFLSRHGLLATATEKGTVHLWSIETGEIIRTLDTGIRPLQALAYNPVDGLLAAGGIFKGGGNHTQLWDVATMEKRAVLNGYEGGYLHALAFSPDGRWLATGLLHAGARVWDVASGSEMVALDDSGSGGLAFSRDGRRLVLTDSRHTAIWRAHTWDREATLVGQRDYVNAMRFLDSGETLVTASKGGIVQVWDPATGREKRDTDVTPRPDAVPREILISLGVWAVLWLVADRRRRRSRSGDLQARDSGVYLLLAASGVFLVNGLVLQGLAWRADPLAGLSRLQALATTFGSATVLFCMSLLLLVGGLLRRYRRRLIFTLPSVLILGGAVAYDGWYLWHVMTNA